MIMTVTGPVDPSELGVTLSHEHIYINLSSIAERFDYPSLIDDEDVMAEELLAFKAEGGTCVVEASLPGMGRQPARLRDISLRTGLKVVMGCGWYRAPYYPPEDLIDRRPVRDLAEQLVREIEDGVAGVGVRPGFLGEIGIQGPWVMPIEERVHRAVARAHRATGLPILQHSVVEESGLEQLTILEDEGADPTRVVIGHADNYPRLDYYLRIIERGAYVGLDGMGMRLYGDYEPRLLRLIRELVDRGHEDRVVLSHDICKTAHLESFDGPGYAYIQKHFVPRLREMGIPEGSIQKLTGGNARRWLTIERSGPIA